MEEIEEVKKEIDVIKERNKKVEADKAWETSKFRVIFIAIVTYIITAIVFYTIGVKNFLTSALIPTIGYYISTQSLPFFKKLWTKRRESFIEKQIRGKERNKEAILNLLERKGRLTNNEIESMLNISDATATRYFDELEKEGKIRQVGKTGKYVYYQKSE